MTKQKHNENFDVPKHVPENLVQLFDFRTGLGSCPHATVAKLHEGPSIFYSPVSHQQRGEKRIGTWVVTTAEDTRTVLQNPELFSSAAPRSAANSDDWALIPLEIDPPMHMKYRMILNPLFSPKVMRELEPEITKTADRLIDNILKKKECDIVNDFAVPYPIEIFLDLMALPKSEMPRFRDWVDIFVHDAVNRPKIIGVIKEYLDGVIEERRLKPGKDIVSDVLELEIDGKKLTAKEISGIVFLLFVGGLDTVVSSLSFYFRFLAENPEIQDKLRSDPDLIMNAVEEFLRAFPVVTTSRTATADTELKGVKIKKGDLVTYSTLLSNSDPKEFSDPLTVDIERSPNRHNAFSFGPHRCLGSHLARRELYIALERFLTRVPAFRVADGAEINASGGGVMGLDAVPITWKK